MELSTIEQVALSREAAWRAVTDFAFFESVLKDRGADIARSDKHDRVGVGACWSGTLRVQGVQREIVATLSRYDPQAGWAMDLQSAPLTGVLRVDLAESRSESTALHVRLAIAAATMRARLALQPMKLALPALDARFAEQAERLARRIEERARGA